jgi:hypothetical protein
MRASPDHPLGLPIGEGAAKSSEMTSSKLQEANLCARRLTRAWEDFAEGSGDS